MRKHNLINFNLQRYEEHLSPFGKQVLKAMIKQWKTDRERVNTSIERHQRHYETLKNTSRVLTFRDSSFGNTSIPATSDKTNEEDPTNGDTSFGLRFIETNSAPSAPTVPHSAALGRALDAIEGAEESPRFGDDLIKSVIENTSRPRNILHDLYNKESDNEDGESKATNDSRDSSNVNWDDMFDTELLTDIHTTTGVCSEAVQNEVKGGNNLKFDFSKEFKPKTKSVKLQPNAMDKETKRVDVKDKKPSQRKTQTKITDAIPKIIKKVETETSEAKSKNPFRKQKYTKTIKNWLNYVNPQNPVEEVPDGPSHAVDNEQELEVITKPKLANDKASKVRCNKTIIQAKLANKGGVMKFGKPTVQESESRSETAGSKSAEKDNVNIAKPKFVAPIKSQLVKDVTYDVRTIDSSNINEYENLNSVENSEVDTDSSSSNGLNQLNSQHTQGLSVPEDV